MNKTIDIIEVRDYHNLDKVAINTANISHFQLSGNRCHTIIYLISGGKVWSSCGYREVAAKVRGQVCV